ncbi:MAG: ATP-binding cassette domain-containing protein [Clostridiales bacterium]|nr:ATP-binding cassette domain-containing protein [Clostridiales bacterium]
MMATAEYAIELKNIRKTFGNVVANNNVNLNVKQGEILALLGENGSGKTTLMNMLSGIYKPDSGEIFINGKLANITSPEDSKKLGIGMVHQHFKLVDAFSAADNIWMGIDSPKYNLKEKISNIKNQKIDTNDNKKKFIFNLKKTAKIVGQFFKFLSFEIKNQLLSKGRNEKIKEVAEKFGFEIDPSKKVYNMAVSEKQTIEIIKVLIYGAKTIILDEPTAVLTVQEIDKLFNILRKMQKEWHSIIIITHKLNEVMEISDRVSIMRKGEYITTVNTDETNVQELTDLMVGKKTDLSIECYKTNIDRPLLEIRDLTINNDEGSKAIDKVNFYIRGGEILGVAGITGCGQKELCEAIAGLRPVVSGEINHKGESIIGLKPEAIIKKGIAMSFIPEDRLGMGLAPSLSITDNMILKTYKGDKWYNPLVDRKKARQAAEKVIKDLNIVTPSAQTPVRLLSGGNVQKVLVGREIQAGPNVIVTAYPVRGLDINSSYAIYDILNA